MKYNCRYCSWFIEGQTQIIDEILTHEKTHIENHINSIKYVESDGKRIKCRMCGCDTEH